MLGGILIVVLTGFLSFGLINALASRYRNIDPDFLKRLFFYHLLMAVVYYMYALFNPSDSWGYFYKVTDNYRGETWMDFYGTSTTFIEFVGYPFIKYLGFSYEACMALFSFFGFVGYMYIYAFFKENIRFRHDLYGIDLITLIFYLPNLHFWSSSFGKGSIIFMAIAFFFFGISKIRSRWIYIAVGGFIIYHVRPHIMLVMLASSVIGFSFSNKGISIPLRLFVLACASVAFFYIYGDVLTLVGVDEQELANQTVDFTHRASDLTKATSGVDITSYSLPMQVFTFLYRPLFIDAPGLLGLIVSFENVFYLLFTLQLLTPSGIKFLIRGNFLVKTAFLSFLTVSFALAQIAGNLGLAIRQKSQVMMLFLFVILMYLDSVKTKAYEYALRQQARRAKMTKVPEKTA
ncbi:MAG TPA: hypothetical protein VIU12_30040 [Chryseolinea sp.]